MTKKVEKEKEENVDVSKTVKEKKLTEDKPTVKKKPSPTKSSPQKNNKGNELSTLVDLVEALPDKENIYLRLSMNNYFNQYMEELEYHRRGYEVRPYINVEEFNKKMGN